MQLLYRAAHFTKSKKYLKSLYKTCIRLVIEQSATVWHSSITKEKSKDLCRVQKAAVTIIMGSDFSRYSYGLQALDINSLPLRREKLSLNMAFRTCSNLRTNKLKTCAIPYMQGLLNKQAKKNHRWTTTNL